MPYKDRAKERESVRSRKRRYMERKKVEKYGEAARGKDMRGRHGNHAKGENNARWNSGRLRTAHGYILVRVPPDHPLAFGPPRLKSYKYAYEHDIIMETFLGRHLRHGEVVHHLNGIRDDNSPENLAVTTVSEHARGHSNHHGARDALGRFKSGKRH